MQRGPVTIWARPPTYAYVVPLKSPTASEKALR